MEYPVERFRPSICRRSAKVLYTLGAVTLNDAGMQVFYDFLRWRFNNTNISLNLLRKRAKKKKNKAVEMGLSKITFVLNSG